jgi:hypothetical protein
VTTATNELSFQIRTGTGRPEDVDMYTQADSVIDDHGGSAAGRMTALLLLLLRLMLPLSTTGAGMVWDNRDDRDGAGATA